MPIFGRAIFFNTQPSDTRTIPAIDVLESVLLMEQFLIIAAAHFLALLSPGPDFFLVIRTSLTAGWRMTTGVCLGIALANGVFIAAAFGGLSIFQPGSGLFLTIQLAGCFYLLHIGWLFILHAGSSSLPGVSRHQASRLLLATSWFRGAGMGLLSGILNPKNALFYVSLAAMVASTSDSWKIIYGSWMFSVVFFWDLLVAVAIGNKTVTRRFTQALPWLERISGAILILLAVMVMARLAVRVVAAS